MKRIAIVGVGNRLMGDDGCGSYIAEFLRDKVQGADVIDLGSSGVNSLDLLKDYDVLIIIDAMLGENDVEVRKMEISVDEEEMASTVLDLEYSGSHGVGIQSLLFMLKLMGFSPEVYLIGCKPYKIEPRVGLSEEVRKNLPLVVRELINLASKFNVRIEESAIKEVDKIEYRLN